MEVSLAQWKQWIEFHARSLLELSLRTGNEGGGGVFVRAKKCAVLRKVGSNNYAVV